MKRIHFFLNAFLALLFFFGFFTKVYSTEKKINLNDQLSFIENKGQVGSDNKRNVLFYVEGKHVNCFLKKTGLSYVWASSKKEVYQMDLEFLNSNPDVKIHSEEMTASVNNYYLAHCPQGILNVNSFHKVVYENIYNKIDLVFYVADGSDQNKSIPIKYDFVVKPGGDPKAIKINYVGNKELKLKQDGSLTAYCPLGELNEGKPFTYQTSARLEKDEIRSTYKVEGAQLSFDVAAYDTNRNLIIDPSVQWSTYYGGTGNDIGGTITVDASGNVYIAGSGPSTGLATVGQTSVIGSQTAIIAKFGPTGARLWATYFGAETTAATLCWDATGDVVYLTGSTTSATGIASSGFSGTYGGGNDGYLAKFNSAGGLVWSRYFGGAGYELGRGASLDHLGNIYLSGCTNSTSGIVTAGAYKTTIGPNDFMVDYLAKFNSAGTQLWGTYYSQVNGTRGAEVATDNQNNVYLCGDVVLNGVPATTIATAGSHQPNYGGVSDAYLAKFSPSGARLWATFYGGTGGENGLGVATDLNDNVFIAGRTISTTGIASAGSHQPTSNGLDLFLAKFNSSGVRQWGTYYGGTLDEFYNGGLAVYNDGRVILAGSTFSTTNIATTLPGDVQTNQGTIDGFLAKFSATGVREWGTYLGGPGMDYAYNVAINSTNDLFVGGYTASTTGIASGGFQNTKGGGTNDLYLLKYVTPACTMPGMTITNPIDAGVITCAAIYSDTKNNFCYGNEYNSTKPEGQTSDDIYYKFTINRIENVSISTCASGFDTYIHLLDASGNHIISNNNNGPLCATTAASLVQTLSKGTYYVVVEGNGAAVGNINLKLSVTQGLKYTEPGDQISLPNSALLNLGTGPFTMEAYVTLKATTDLSIILSKRNNPMVSDGFAFGAGTDGRLWLQLAGSDINAPATSPTLYDGNCHYVAATRDASNVVKLYVDGVLVKTATSAIDINSSYITSIGFDRLGGGYLNGYIRDVRIWNIARTQALIQNNMHKVLTVPQTGLVGYWRLLEGAGQSATDFSGNSLTGILGGTTAVEANDPIYKCAPGCPYLRPASNDEVTNIESSSVETALSIYPNPFSQTTNVIVTGKIQKAIVEIMDMNGSIVYKNENYVTNETITLGENIQPGFYILRVITAEGSKSLKLIKTE